jgi:NhaC family Na+:H+ antiporter
MLYTTVPSISITLLIFLGIGIFTSYSDTVENTQALSRAIGGRFDVNPLLFLVPAAVIWMIIRKVNALAALLIGTLLGGVFAIIFQPHIIREVAGEARNFAEQSYMAVLNAMGGSVSIHSENEIAAGLLKSKGMAGMLNTIWLILCALTFGGIMESVGLLKRITSPLVRKAKSTGSLVATTAGSCVFVNVTASDQYLSIVVPGRMFAETYRERGLAPQNLSRTLEDAGTVTSVLVPWNTCGATQAAVLGVSTFAYAPFAFFNIISPLMTIFFAYMGIKIAKLKPAEAAGHAPDISDSPRDKPVDYLQ